MLPQPSAYVNSLDHHFFHMRREKTLDMVAGLARRGRAMERLAQRGAARQAHKELADQLLELVERQALGHLGAAHLEVAQQQLTLVGRRWVIGQLAAPQL